MADHSIHPDTHDTALATATLLKQLLAELSAQGVLDNEALTRVFARTLSRIAGQPNEAVMRATLEQIAGQSLAGVAPSP